MALHFILGGSGSGKSTELFSRVGEMAKKNPDIQYLVLVPDQFTLETQRILVEQNEGRGILNIDVLSFHRLAYRAFEEMPALRKTVLEDMGKMMLLRKVFSEERHRLQYFKRGLHRMGFLDECKSFLCELTQYAIEDEDFDTMINSVGEESLMGLKLMDIRLIYRKFQEKLGDTYMMAEELVPQLTRVVSSLEKVKNSVVCLDGFTGFTPTQYELLGEMLSCCRDMYVTVTMDRTSRRGEVFRLSRDTIRRLAAVSRERGVSVEEEVWTGMGKEHVPYRVAGKDELAFLEKNLFSYGGETWKKKSERVKITLCHRECEEASYVARKILWLVREEGYRYEDIAVVTAKIEAYEQELSRELERLCIPYFLDYKRSIGVNALAEYVLSFCHMVERGMDYESTFRFLRCGLSPLTREETDLLENYVLAQGRRGLTAYRQEWKQEVKRLDLVQINELRRKFLAGIENAVSACRGGKKNVREFTEILYHLIEDNNIFERLQEKSRWFEGKGELILAREYRRIYRVMMDLFDELVELLGEEQVSFQEYQELLGAGISEGLVGFIPPESHQVVIGDVRRTRLQDIKVLFFIGINDDCIPRVKGTPGILSEAERKRLSAAGMELAPEAEEESFTEQFYLYLVLTKASEKLFLTYSLLGNDGGSRRPAYLIDRVRALYEPKLKVEWEEKQMSVDKVLGTDNGKSYLIQHLSDGTYEKDSAWWEIASFYEKKESGYLRKWLQIREASKGKTKLHREAAEQIYGTVLQGSVTRLEKFMQCPYAHFVQYGLKLHEREQYEIGDMDIGNVFHKSWEHFSHELEKRGKEWQELSEPEVRDLARECIDYVAERYEGKKYYQSKRTQFMLHRLKNEMENSVWAMWKQMTEGKFYQHYTEKHFSGRGDDGVKALCIPLKNGRELNLGGVIDRVDICETEENDFVKIIDYKSSDFIDLSLAKIYYGLQMQLVAYLAATKELLQREHPEKQVVPAAMFYYAIKEKDLEWKEESEEEHRKRLLESMKSKGYVNIEPEVRNSMGDEYKRNISTGQFECLMRHTKEKMRQCGEKILEGEIAAAPYVYEDAKGCRYCEYGSVCGLESEERRAYSRVMEKMKDDEVWEVLYEQYSLDSGSEEDYEGEK